MCGSNLVPKALDSVQITPHFAHIDASKCNSETMIHWWFKNKFLIKGDRFAVVSDKTIEYVCDEVLVEQSYKVGDKTYKPDVTVITKAGETIYFEMDYSNKKKIRDYLDTWIELGNMVVEVDIKKLIMRDSIPAFKALFYNGKCFNVKKNDTYYNTIGKYKEQNIKGIINQDLKERIQKLDWFWDDILRYKKGEVDIEHMANLMDRIEGTEKYVVNSILEKPRCVQLHRDYLAYKKQKYLNNTASLIAEINNKYHGAFRVRLEDENDIFTLTYKIEKMTNKEWVGWSYLPVCFDYMQLGNEKRDFNKDIEDVIKIIDKGILHKLNKKIQRRIKRNKSIESALNSLSQEYSALDKYIKIDCLYHSGYRDYETEIVVSFSNWEKIAFNITNDDAFYTKDVVKIESYLSALINEKLNGGLKCNCFECASDFILGLGEMKFYSNKGYELPKRCPFCRKQRRALKNNN